MRSCLALAMLALLAACGRESTTPSAPAEAFDLPADQVAFGVQHVITREGVRTAVMVSDTAYLYEDVRRFDVYGVSLRFFNDQGAEVGTLTARTGEYSVNSGHFVARGDVVLLSEGPAGLRRLETQELHYDVDGDRLWSDTAFTLHEAGRTTTGTTFRSDARFETWEVTGARTGGALQQDPGLRF